MIDTNYHFLYASTIHVDSGDGVIQTVLGSCIAVCLWDKRLKIGGMNHFMLPYWEGTGLSSPKYGDIAIPRLIQKMQQEGSLKNDLIAKVFGGAEVLKIDRNHFNIGQRNIEVAQEILHEFKIPIVGHSTSGNRGRKINFNMNDGSVHMKFLEDSTCRTVRKAV